MSNASHKKLSLRRKILLAMILGSIALCFVDAPTPMNTDTAPLPAKHEEYHRAEEQTYLTFPEWYIVYSSDEYANFIKNNPPSGFSYFGSIGQFWSSYWNIYQLTKDQYPFNTGYHVMVSVIGTSLTVEYTIKGVYENTIGRLTEWTQNSPTQEDIFAAETAGEYVDFIRVYPWYEFVFAKKLGELWKETDILGDNLIRKIERKFILSLEYGGKAAYGWLIKKLTYLSYEPASPFTVIQAKNVPQDIAKDDLYIKPIKHFQSGSVLFAVPRYEAFKQYARKLSKAGVEFEEIAGNSKIIFLTVKADRNWQYNFRQGEVAFTQEIITEPTRKRTAITLPVTFLSEALVNLEKQNIELEHIYDY